MIKLWEKIRDLSGRLKISPPLTRKRVSLMKWDLSQDYIHIDDFWFNKFGYRKTKSYTMDSWLVNVHPDDCSRIKNIFDDFFKNRNSDGIEIEYRLKRKSGEYVWLFMSAQITRYSKGRPAQLEGIIFDITEQKNTENELSTKNSEIEALYEESEAQNEEMAAIMDELQKNQMDLEAANSRLIINETKFRKIFEHSPIGIIQSTISGDILDANSAFCSIFGYDSIDDLKTNLKNTNNLYLDEGGRERLIKRLSKKEFVNFLDNRAAKKDGTVIYENIYMMLMSDEYNGENYLTTFVEDITELRSSQFERDLLFNYTGDLLSITDFTDGLKQANAAWTAQLGWEIDELKEMKIKTLIHPDDISKSEEFLEKLKKTDKPLTLTNRYRTKNNGYRIIRWNSIAFNDIKLVFSSGRDETERIEAELELKQIWDRLDLALKAGIIGLWEFNALDDSIIMNAKTKEMFGLETIMFTDVLKNWDKFVYKDDYASSLKAMLNILTKQTETYVAEYRVQLPDGKIKWFFSRGKVVEFNSEGNPSKVAGSIMDITEQKEAESKRINLELKMQQAQKLESLGVLAGGIAHDFNNLLTGILGNSDILLHELPQDKEVQQRLMEIKRATKLASQLTNQMLAYSGKGSFIIENIDINDLIIEMNSLLEASISKKVELSYSFLPDIPGIRGDATQIRQIIMNLILNGSDAIENNGTIDVRTSFTALTHDDIENLTINFNLTPGEYVMLEVKDSGCGIEKDKLKQIFEPFYTTKFTGRGLGLAAVSGIIRSHNAGLIVESKPGTGTVFKIYFPVSAEHPKTVKPAAKTEPSFSNKDLTILIADDEKYIRDLTTKMLNISGYKVHLARNGREAIDIFIKNRDEISCILLDLTMPELDGREALVELRKIDPVIPIIITSGYSENDIITRFSDENISGFLQKPYNLEDIISAIENAVR